MGGSSGSSNKPTPKKDEPTGTIPGTGPMMTQPAFIGNNQNLLAQQIAAGGYGQVPDLMSMLTNTFTPMQILDTRPGAVTTPTTPTTPTTGGGGSSGGGGKPGKGNKPPKGSGGGLGATMHGSSGWELLPQNIQSLVR